MPDNNDKIKVLYDAVSSDYNVGTLYEFKSKLADGNKRKAFYDAIGSEYNLGSLDEFNKKIDSSLAQTYGPVGPTPPVMKKGELPSFQEQVQTLQKIQQNRFEDAAAEDKKKTGSYMGALYDSFISSIDPIRYLGEEAFFDAYGYMSGKKLTPVERDVTRAAFRGAFNPALGGAGFAGKTQSEEYMKDVQSGWDVTDGFGVKDLKALGVMGTRVLGDLGVAAAAQAVGVPMGTTYFLQGYGSGLEDYTQMAREKGIEEDEKTKQVYALSVGTVNGLLEKFAFDKIFGKGPAFNAIKKQIVSDLLTQTARSSGKLTVEALEKTATDLVKKAISTKGNRLIRAGYGAAVEFATEGTQAGLEDAVRLLSNKIQGEEVFDEQDIKKNFVKNIANSALAGLALGAPMGLASTYLDRVDNKLVEEIANAKNEEELNTVLGELEDVMVRSNASEEEIELMRQNAARYNNIKQTIPVTASNDQKAKIISLIDRRAGVDEKINQWNGELEQIDEAMKPDVESELTTLFDSKDMINDEIREVSTGQQYNYYEDKGKFFKRLGYEEPVEISKSRFELQKIKEDATKTSEQQVQEGPTASDISQREGAQETNAQEEASETDIGYSYIVGEEGDEVPIAALLNKKVRINGQPAILYQQGQTVEARIIGTNRIIEIGNVNKLMNELPEAYNIELDEVLVTETPQGYRIEGQALQNTNENPLDAIGYDSNGNVMNVVLTTPAGKRRKFRGQVAKDLAYQIQLKEILKDEQEFENFLEREHQQELENARLQAVAEEQAAGDTEAVPAVEAEPTPTTAAVPVEPRYGRVTIGKPITGIRGPRLKRKAVSDANRIVSSIKSVVGSLTGRMPEINLHDQATFEEAVVAAGGTREDSTSRGFYLGTDGTIHINLDNVASDTVLHEGFHPILDFLESRNPEVINQFFAELEAIPEAAPFIEAARTGYKGDDTQKKEAITSFVAGIANGDVIINPSNFQKIRKFVLDLLNKLGMGVGSPTLMNVKNPGDLVKLADYVTEVFREGEDAFGITVGVEAARDAGQLQSVLGEFEEKAPTQEEPIAKSGQIQFSKTIYSNSGIEKSPALDRNEFKTAVNEGRISVVNPYESLKDKFFAITFPDDFFTGEIKFNGKTIAYGNGGVFFSARFGKKGDVWAAAGENSANNFTIQGNESLRKNNGEGIIVLSKGEDIKQSTSLEANIAFINTVIKYADSIGELDNVVKGIKTAYTVGKAKSAESIIDSFNQYLAGGRGESGQRMVDAKQAFNVMSSGLIKEAGSAITRMFRDMGFEGETYFNKTQLKKGEYVATTQGLKAMFVDMLQEDFLKGVNNGAVYAALKFNSPIKFEKDLYHPSYPFVMKTVDGSPVRLEVFNKTFNSYGKEGVAIYGQERNKENAFGVATTTKPDFKLDPTFEDNPAQKNLSDKLNDYKALEKPQFQKLPTEQKQKRTDTASEKLKQLFNRDNIPLSISEAKAMVNEVLDWASWYDGLSSYVGNIFREYSEDVLSLLPLASQAANSATTVSLAINNAEKIYKGENPIGVAEYYGYVTDFIQGKGIRSDKMYNFFKALSGDKNAVAVDMHVWSIIMGKDPNKKQVNPINKAEFDKAKEFVNTIANELGLAPREVQAALWAANILRTGNKPTSYEQYFEKQLEKGLAERIDGWRNEGYKPFSEVRKAREAVRAEGKEPQFQRTAPNGKPSNLNAKQYEQVRTPAFKKWFGDWENDPANASKIVDENGEPLVVYHGSVAPDIEIFDRSLSKRESSGLREMGVYFTTNKDLAELYSKARTKEGNISSSGKIYESFLNLRKVKEFDAKGENGIRAWDNLQVDAGYKIAQNRDAMDFLMNGKFGVEKVDGIIAKNISDMESYGIDKINELYKGTVYLVFDDNKNSIKSATDNAGTFSTIDNRIQFQKAVPTKKVKGVVGKTLKEQFNSFGLLGKDVKILQEKMSGELTAEVNKAEAVSKKAIELAKKYKGVVSNEDMEKVMTGQSPANTLPTDLADALNEAREHIDNMTERLIELGVIDSQESIDLYRQNKGKYLLRSYEAINYKDNTLAKALYGEGLNIDNVSKKLNNVDNTVVDAALKYLANRAKLNNPSLTDAEAMKIARADANEILADSESYVTRGLKGSTNVSSLTQRKDIVPEIRALMGEYGDPIYNYYASIFKMAGLSASRNYLNELRNTGLNNFLFEKGATRPEEASTLIAAEGSETLAPLNGLYTFPELAEALKTAEKERTSILVAMAGKIRAFKTVYNPATHVKNLIGNMGFAVSNGHWNEAPETFKYIKQLISGNKSKELLDLMDTLNRQGVLNSSVGIGELKSYFDKHTDVDAFLASIYDAANKQTTFYKSGKKAVANLNKIPRAIEKAYAIEDDVFKILGFVNESNRYAQAIYGKRYFDLNADQKADIKNQASEIVKNTYPTFSRVPKFVRGLSKVLFLGNFLSFPVESVRVSYNTLKLAKQEIQSGNPKLKRIGATRLAGTAVYNSLFSTISYYGFKLAGAGLTSMLGFFADDEEQKEKAKAINKYVAPWVKEKDKYVSQFSDGKLIYWDYGSLDSYSYQKAVWNSFWSNMNDEQGFFNSMGKSVYEGIKPFIQLDMVADNLINTYRNEDRFGNKIYNPEEGWWDITKKIGGYMLKNMSPGAVSAAMKVYDYYDKEESEKMKNEIISQFGPRRYEVDLEKAFLNHIYSNAGNDIDAEIGFKNRLANARKIYTDAKKQKLSPSELDNKYQEAISKYKEILQEVGESYRAAIKGGVDSEKLSKMIYNANLGDRRNDADIYSIINNKYDYNDVLYIKK